MEDFQQMISDTYNEFYGKFRDQFNPNEYLEIVRSDNLLQRFGEYLDQNEENILTMKSMPTLDLGDIPPQHSFLRGESEQVFNVPSNTDPSHVYVRYSNFVPKYFSIRGEGRMKESNLGRRIELSEFNRTL